MSLLVYKVADYSFTAEREQYRTICELLKAYYASKDELCLFLANYNIYDSELDGIIIKNDAVISVEFKNYGGEVIAVENGDWKLADGTIVKGGSRKSPYQQAKVNHVKLKNGLVDGMILPQDSVKNVPALIVFNQSITCDNRLSGKVRSWLHITDNNHFLHKISDITEPCTDLSNEDILALIPKLALYEDNIDEEYSDLSVLQSKEEAPIQEEPIIEPSTPTPAQEDIPSSNVKVIDKNKIRVSSDNIITLAPNEIFVFGSNLYGKHIGGAARHAYNHFEAEWGVGDGPTGQSYAIPTMHGGIDAVEPFIKKFIQYASEHPEQKFLVTKIGCGVAKFRPDQIAPLFADAVGLTNIYLPAEFWMYL